MKQALYMLAILMLVTLVGCTLQFQPSKPPQDSASLRVNSTYATTPLIETVMSAYLDAYPTITIEHHSANYSSNLSQLENREIAYFTSNHLEQRNNIHLWAAPLAQDGLAIITHPTNPVQNLSIENLRRIYRGYITNWAEVGGEDLPIIIMSREDGSGTRAEFDRLVMGQQRTSPNAQLASSTLIILQQVASNSGAIAYLPYSQVTSGIQLIAIDNILPSLENIASSQYPLRNTIYMIGLAEPEGMYRNFVGWIQSSEGQAIIQTRYAPLP